VPSKPPSSIAWQAINVIWFHITFGQVFNRMVGRPSSIYPRGPSTISFNLGMCVHVMLLPSLPSRDSAINVIGCDPDCVFSPTWIGWFQWSYGWIESDDSSKETNYDDEEKNSSG
jgi:hypothetical protein